jgi:4-hydroxybenzoate polyprenyltransferase
MGDFMDINKEIKDTGNARTGQAFSGKLEAVLVSLRPVQWTKNAFVFAGLIFSRSFLDVYSVARTVYAFLLFSMISGSVYMINDVIDKERDRLHPRKSGRPIASGRLSVPEALACSAMLALAALALSFMLDFAFFIIILGYFLLVVAYSLKLKNVLIVDVIAIAAGFVLRTVGGAVAIDVRISPWLIVCTTLLALFLALNKRKSELLSLADGANEHRAILEKYTPGLIDQMLSVVTSTTVMSYSLYTFNAGKSYYMMLTIPFVLYGVFRYQYLASGGDMAGSPELALLKDRPLMVNMLLWAATSIAIVTLFY